MSTDTFTPRASVMPIVRVAVLAAADAGEAAGSGRVTDVALPTELPLREILPAVRKLVLPTTDGTDAADAEDGVPIVLSLAPVGGAPFSLDATLDTVGVVDGDLLALQPVPAGPPAPRIVEDIGDAAVIFSAAREKPWGAAHIERFAGAALVGLIVVATAFAAVHRAAVGGNASLLVSSAIAVLTVLAALMARATSPKLATALSVAALVPVATAFALAVPGEFGAAQVLLAAAGVTAWSIVSITIAERAIALFTAVSVVGFGVAIPAAASLFWVLNTIAIGAILIVVALVVTVQAPQLSALWARFPVPQIPAPGDPTPSALPLAVLRDLPRRVRVSDSHQTGFIAGAVLLASAGALLVAAAPGVSAWAWYVVGAVALGAVLRARVWDSAPCKAWLLALPFILALGFLVVFAVEGRFVGAWAGLGALVALTAVWVVAALFPKVASPETYSLPMRRVVGFLASAVDASLIPVLAYLVGLFELVLNR